MLDDMVHVVVAGAGAMGSLMGGLLAETGMRVTLLARNAAHVNAVRERGLQIVGEGGNRIVRLRASTEVSSVAQADVVVVLCKSTATRMLSDQIGPLMRPGSIAVSFQNGLGNEELMADALGRGAVIAGLTSLGATLEAPGVVRNYATLPSAIGELTGGLTTRATELAQLFSRHGVPTQATGAILEAKWKKLLLNVAMSATSGLTGLSIGAIAAAPDLGPVARRAMDEAATVAAAEGIILDPAERYATFDGIVNSGASSNVTSMRRDIEAGRQTENAAIYGSVIVRARKHGVAVPTLEAFAALVGGLEQANLNNDAAG